MEKSLSVVGHGSWGTALVKLAAENGVQVVWYVPNDEIRRSLRETGKNCKYLSDAALPIERILPTDSLPDAVEASPHLLFVVPSAYLRSSLAPLLGVSLEGKIVISAIKGLEAQSGRLISGFFSRVFGVPSSRYAVIAGPSHAEEVVKGHPAYLTLAAADVTVASEIFGYFAGDAIRIEYTGDVAGVEYAGVLKNIYAIGAGMAVGAGYPDNFLSVYVACCLQEMKEYLARTLPGNRDVTASAYAGDLLVTAYSPHSRNRTLGVLLGKGKTPSEALSEMKMVAEGFNAAKLIVEKHHCHKPIVKIIYETLHMGVPAAEALKRLRSTLS
ncbi:MAG: glycerol-3-phosphate dehydrogenase [Bacteroidia bacterium]|nr:glycerol-3-phosphate dehydrogenase [Bacteroidia bacterium]